METKHLADLKLSMQMKYSVIETHPRH